MTDETRVITPENVAGDPLPARENAHSTGDADSPACGEAGQQQGPTEDPGATSVGVREEVLNEKLGDIRQKDDRFQHWTGQARRNHNRRHATRLTVWVKESLKRPGYIERKFTSGRVIIASNSKTIERGIYGGAVRLGSSNAAREENGDPMLPHVVSRIAHTMAGISAFCQTHGLELKFGNEKSIYEEISDLTDQKLQELADTAAPLANAEDHLQVEDLVTHVIAPSGNKDSGKVEQGGSAAAPGDTPEGTDASGDAAIQQEVHTGAAPFSETDSTPGCGIHDDHSTSVETTASLVREYLPLFGQLSRHSDTTVIPAEVTLFVGLPADNENGILIYGPIKTGKHAVKAVQIMMAKHRVFR